MQSEQAKFSEETDQLPVSSVSPGGDVQIVRHFIEPADSPVDYHHQALDYWNERRANRFAPTWRDISLIDFPNKAIPLISVTDIDLNPFRSVYRFWGSELTRIYGGDYTRRSPNCVPPAELGLSKSGGCGRLADEKSPHLEIKEFQAHSGVLGNALILRLPLSNDGTTVNHGVNLYYFEIKSSDQPLHMFFSTLFKTLSDR